MRFLHQYACENKILFRVSRSGLSIEDISNDALELKKNSKKGSQSYPSVEDEKK